jgi:hypothetical protein
MTNTYIKIPMKNEEEKKRYTFEIFKIAIGFGDIEKVKYFLKSENIDTSPESENIEKAIVESILCGKYDITEILFQYPYNPNYEPDSLSLLELSENCFCIDENCNCIYTKMA